MSSDGRGLSDNAAQAVHQFMGHADQEQHQHEVERKRGGLSDESIENERVFLDGVERRASQGEGSNSNLKTKIKETINKFVK